MKFYNRKKELSIIKETVQLSHEVGAQFIVISGRRRIGKSELIRESVKKGKYLYFFVSKKRSSNLLKEFNNQFNQFRGEKSAYTDWDSFIEALLIYCTKHKIVLIFDEFQEFGNIETPIYSIFQKHWEYFQKKKDLTIIVAGSLISLIENIFFSSKEPLYGRATRRITLHEFNFTTVYKILKDNRVDLNLKNLLSFYTVFGGNPYYYNQIEKEGLFNASIFEIIDTLILQKYGSLHSEGREILIKEFGSEHSTYFSILEAISKGHNTFSKLEAYTQLDDGFLTRSLKSLDVTFSLIRKDIPIFPNNRKAVMYVITDNFLLFWFRYVYAYQSSLGLDTSKFVLDKVKKEFNSLVGQTFERYSAEYLLNSNKAMDLNIINIGRWWDKHGEIDLIIEGEGNKVAFVECKLSQSGANKSQIDKFLQTTARIDAVRHKEQMHYFVVGGAVSDKKKSLLKKNNIVVIELL